MKCTVKINYCLQHKVYVRKYISYLLSAIFDEGTLMDGHHYNWWKNIDGQHLRTPVIISYKYLHGYYYCVVTCYMCYMLHVVLLHVYYYCVVVYCVVLFVTTGKRKWIILSMNIFHIKSCTIQFIWHDQYIDYSSKRFIRCAIILFQVPAGGSCDGYTNHIKMLKK